jgi:hypothetical protein
MELRERVEVLEVQALMERKALREQAERQVAQVLTVHQGQAERVALMEHKVLME